MNAEGEIWDALRGALVTRALGLAADLRVAQALADGPRSHEALARERGIDADAVYRVLRALASDGIFEEIEPGVFGNTAASEVPSARCADSAHPGTEPRVSVDARPAA